MTERRRAPVLLAPLLALLVPAAAAGAYVVFGSSGHSDGDRPVSGTGTSAVQYRASATRSTGSDTKDHAKTKSTKTFAVQLGAFAPLYPGASTPIRMTVTNPQSFKIEVDSVVVSAASSGACSSVHLITGTYPQSQHVIVPPKNGTATIIVPFGMRRSAPDVCQSKPFVVTVTATAVKK